MCVLIRAVDLDPYGSASFYLLYPDPGGNFLGKLKKFKEISNLKKVNIDQLHGF